MILDTAFVLDLLDGDEGAVRKAEELEEDGIVMRLPAMTVTELYIGVGTGVADESEQRQIRQVIEAMPFVPMDEELSEQAGRLLGKSGVTVGKGDAAIAATAIREEEPVLTRNTDDFETLGIEVESY